MILLRSVLLSRFVDKFGDLEMVCISLGLIVGGVEVFVFVVKFCYGIDLEFLFLNVVGFCCVVEYFEMMEEFEEGNVISKLEVYLSFVVLILW